MSIAIALSNAYSGLAVSTRQAELVSRNVANASTPGYVTKSLNVSNRVLGDLGAGVKIDGIGRAGDAFLTADRRRADAGAGGQEALAAGLQKLAGLIAPTDEVAGLPDYYAALNQSLRALEATPDSEASQLKAADAARRLASRLQTASADAAQIRMDADAEIARQVRQANDAMARIDQLNGEIRRAVSTGRDSSVLEDQREQQIEIVNRIVPVRAKPTDGGGMALVSQGGAILMDNEAGVLVFTPTYPITDDMTQTSGALSGVTLRGSQMSPTGTQNAKFLAGGTLEAAFQLRDEAVPTYTAQLDALARDLMERFQNPAVDTTLAVGDAGLFVDGSATMGPAFDIVANPSQQVGLARRLGVNAAVDPTQGGEAWRMRDGMNAAAPNPNAASSAIVANLVDALSASRAAVGPVSPDAPFAPLDPTGFTAPKSAVALVEGVTALRENAAVTFEEAASFARGAATALLENEQRITAVDTDAELRALLEIEKAFQANARILSVIDGLLARLLEI